jgi:hypothetical protein
VNIASTHWLWQRLATRRGCDLRRGRPVAEVNCPTVHLPNARKAQGNNKETN